MKMSCINDEFIKENLLCYNSNNGVYQLKAGAERKILNEPSYAQIKEYLDNRYPDANANGDVTYKEIIWRITHDIDVRPVCPICGNPVPFRPSNTAAEVIPGYANTCSKSCRYELSKTNMETTMMEKYGCKSNVMLPEMQKLAHDAITEETAEKRKRTMNERYGIDGNFYKEDVHEKAMKNSAEFRTRMSEQYQFVKSYLDKHPEISLSDIRSNPEFSDKIDGYEYYSKMNDKRNETNKSKK